MSLRRLITRHVTTTRRLFNLRWRLSSKLLAWSEHLIASEVQEVDRAVLQDPQRAAALIDNLGCRVDRAGVTHPTVAHLEGRRRQLAVLKDAGIKWAEIIEDKGIGIGP